MSVAWIESTLYIITERQDGIHLEKMDFGKVDEDDGQYATNLEYRVHLDSLVKLTGSYQPADDTTTWTLPYDQATNGGTYRIVKGGQWGDEAGIQIPVLAQNVDTVITARGDFEDYPVYIGREYLSKYELSEVVLRGGGTQNTVRGARTGGRLQLRRVRIVYTDTGTFQAVIRSQEDTDEYSYTFTSQFLNEATFGRASLDAGVYAFDVGADARNAQISIESLSFLPFTLSNAEWEGRFYQRSVQA